MLIHVELRAAVRLPPTLAFQGQQVASIRHRRRSTASAAGVHGEEVRLRVPDPLQSLPEC